MSTRIRSRRALVLLLALVLGGIATPLAHQVDHLVDLWSDTPATELTVTTPDSSSAAHECELCDVRLAAADSENCAGVQLEVLPDHEAAIPKSVAHHPVRPFDGRAPPSLV